MSDPIPHRDPAWLQLNYDARRTADASAAIRHEARVERVKKRAADRARRTIPVVVVPSTPREPRASRPPGPPA